MSREKNFNCSKDGFTLRYIALELLRVA